MNENALFNPERDYKEMMLTSHVMENIHVAAAESVGGYTLHSMRLDQIPQVCDMMTFRLTACVVAEVLKPQEDCDFGIYHKIILPDGWWQQLKEDHFPAWIIRRWPVKMKTLEVKTNARVEVLATYPKLNKVFPKGENRPVIKVMGRDRGHGTCVIKITKGQS